jgi:hypothetical protein
MDATLPIDDHFHLNRPDWDYGNAEGRERLWVYRQTLMAGLRAAAHHPTNLAKFKAIMKEKMKARPHSLSVFTMHTDSIPP